MKGKKPFTPKPRSETLRLQLIAQLRGQPLSAREISARLGLPEKEVYTHLEHVRRTLHGEETHLEILPAACKKCGFSFDKRGRMKKPGRCPLCRGEAIAEPRFVVRGRD